LTVEQELGKQLDAEETGACNQTQNSTVAQECGEETVVERRDAACVINPSFATSQEVVKKLHFVEMDVSFERLSDDAVPLVEQSAAVPVRNISSEVLPANTNR
jgi:hypothetical protein